MPPSAIWQSATRPRWCRSFWRTSSKSPTCSSPTASTRPPKRSRSSWNASGRGCGRCSSHREPGRAGAQAPDGSRFKALLFEDLQHLSFGRSSHQQSAARLRVGEDLLLPVGEPGGKLHFVAVAFPVALGGAGGDALLRPLQGLGVHGRAFDFTSAEGLEAARILKRLPAEAEPGAAVSPVPRSLL